jgi:hypothetical protein
VSKISAYHPESTFEKSRGQHLEWLICDLLREGPDGLSHNPLSITSLHSRPAATVTSLRRPKAGQVYPPRQSHYKNDSCLRTSSMDKRPI